MYILELEIIHLDLTQGETPEKKVGGKIKRQDAPFQILPIWTDHNEGGSRSEFLYLIMQIPSSRYKSLCGQIAKGYYILEEILMRIFSEKYFLIQISFSLFPISILFEFY